MNNKVYWSYFATFALNLIATVFIALTIYTITNQISSDGNARDFLESVSSLPHVPLEIPVYTISSICLIGFTNILTARLKNRIQWLTVLLMALNFILCMVISYYLNFSYKGIFLLFITSIFLYVAHNGVKVFFLVLAGLGFIFMDFDLFRVVSFKDYVKYYDVTTQFYYFSVKNTLDSISLILAILFFITLIQSKIKENKEYILLNNRLNEKVEELKIANAKLEDYTKMSIENARAKERNRMAREIHDVLGHSLTSIAIGLEACLNLVDGTVKKQLKKIRDIANKGLLDARRSVKELKIDIIQKYELIPALERLVKDINNLSYHHATLSISGEVASLEEDEEQTIYRVIQESITNSVRHGYAKNIDTELAFLQKEISITVKDDGIGCDCIKKDFGLLHIEERVNSLHGTVEFKSKKGYGFETKVIIPLRGEINDKSYGG